MTDNKRLAELACQAAMISAAAKVRADYLRDHLAATLTTVGGDRIKTPLGEVRLDGANTEPKAYIADDDAYASWVAERHPEQVTATITIPADRLADAIEAMEFAGINTHSAKVVPTADGLTHLQKATLEPAGDSAWIAVSVDGEQIPGVEGRRAGGTWKVVPTRGLATDAKTAAIEEVQRELAEIEAAPVVAEVEGSPAVAA